MENRKVFYSPSNSPFLNLAIEDYLFRNFAENFKILFLYRNAPCVVLGRFQNPLIEADLNELRKRGITLVRRQSGGGTVYQDEGNLNISFSMNRKDYNKEENLNFVINAINDSGLNLKRNHRNDLVIERNGLDYKVSGSAFKENRDICLHHFTLLIDSNLEGLKEVLFQGNLKRKFSLDSKGVKSTPSRVLNLKEVNPKIEVQEIVSILSESWNGKIIEVPFNEIQESDFFLNSQTKDWIFGETPPFKHHFKFDEVGYDFKYRKCLILEILKDGEHFRDEFLDPFIGKKVSEKFFLDLKNVLNSQGISSEVRSILEEISSVFSGFYT